MLSIVLSRHNTREFDQVVSLFVLGQGKIEVLAKGIKKITSKNSSNLEIFSVVDIEVAEGKEINHLTKVQSVRFFKNIYNDFDKIFLAGYGAALVCQHILAGEHDDRVFYFLRSFFEFLDSADKINSTHLATAFIFKLWHYLGFSVEASQYLFWLERDWNSINSLVLSEVQTLEAYEFAQNFAQTHSGVKLAKFIESDRIGR